MFLHNHDELDLGRLMPGQREAVFAAFGPAADMQLYGRGIRRHLAPMLQVQRGSLHLMAALRAAVPVTGAAERLAAGGTRRQPCGND